ncbi:adenylate cyclase [Gammaproteobacteria bacterium]
MAASLQSTSTTSSPPAPQKVSPRRGWDFHRYALRYVLTGVVLVLFLLHAFHKVSFPFLDRLEFISYDTRLRLGMPGGIDPRVVILDIDEKSLAEEGHWPWPRQRLAALMDRLFDQYHIGVVGFDVVFAEPDYSSGLPVLQELAAGELKEDRSFQARLPGLQSRLDYDQHFAAALRGRRVVLGYYFGDLQRTTGQLPPPVLDTEALGGHKIGSVTAVGYGANLPVFQEAAAGSGHFTPSADVDGIIRRVPLLIEYEKHYYESLVLAMVRVAMDQGQGKPKVVPEFTEAGLEWLQVGNRHLPVDNLGQTLVPYRGKRGSFPYISASDVLHGRVAPEVLARTMVLVGTTAPGLMDLRATPVGEIYPGVEIHANLLAGIIDDALKERPTYTLAADIFQTLFLGGLAVVLLPLLGPLFATLTTATLLAITLAWNFAAWQWGNLVLPLAPVVVLIMLVYALDMAFGYLMESRNKRQITHLFGQYVPPELVDEMSRDPSRFSMEGTSREMSVLFSDVRNFTSISEGLDPRSLSRLMNAYLTPMTQIIHQERGTIDKYIGDAIMAFWGAPLDDPDHARHAVQAALALQQRAMEITEEFRALGWPEIRIGVGVNTGVMRVGNMGSQFRTAYTVMGDAVNLASRLEGLTKQYKVTLIVGEQTRDLLPDFAFRELDRVRVKGKQEPIVIYEPLGNAQEVNPALAEELKSYRQALHYYRAQDWEHAAVAFYRLREKSPQTYLYSLYLERIEFFRANPPGKEWDGVFIFTTK